VSRRRVREGVFCRYWFQTWRATSCGEDLLERDGLDFEDGVEKGLGEESPRPWDGTGLGGGGVEAVEYEDFLGAIAEELSCARD
jgi:hypothetical protein